MNGAAILFRERPWFAVSSGHAKRRGDFGKRAAHQDRRKLATEPARFRPFYEATPFFPFTGHATLQGLRELLPVVAPVGIAVAVVVRHFHAPWFGG